MKVTGSHVLHAPRQQVWDALQDPAVLVRSIPGCHELEAVADDVYTARVHAGVASIKGTYEGRVALSDQDPPSTYTLKAAGSGGPGTIDATATVRLIDGGDGLTTVEYQADAVVGGAVGGVGQRVLAGVAQRNAAAFFAAVDRYLAGDLEAVETADATGDRAAVGAAAPGTSAETRVFQRPGAVPAPATSPAQLLLAALVGAAVALLGVLVGRRGSR